MRAPAFIKSLSSKFSKRQNSSMVAPFFEQSPFSQQIVDEVDAIRTSKYASGSANWLGDVLDATIISQRLAEEHLSTANFSNISDTMKEIIDDHLEINTDLLDTCNDLLEKMDIIQRYNVSFKATLRLLDIAPMSSRVQETLSECTKLEGQCAMLDKRGAKLHRLMGRKVAAPASEVLRNEQDLELHEALIISKEVALEACYRLQKALSFKSKGGLIRMRSKVSLQIVMEEDIGQKNKKGARCMMNELEEIVMASRTLHEQVKSQKGNVDIDILRSSCEALEEGIQTLEQRVGELYRQLISLRMTLLGVLSQC